MFARAQRQHASDRREQRRAVVANGAGQVKRRMTMATLGRHQSRARLQQRIKAGLVVLWSPIAKPINRHENDARVDRRKRFIIEAELAHPARPQVFHYHVRTPHQPMNYLPRLARTELERKAAFTLVPAEKSKAEMAKGVAFETFYLDHVGSHLAENHG